MQTPSLFFPSISQQPATLTEFKEKEEEGIIM